MTTLLNTSSPENKQFCSTSEVILVLTTLPDIASAEKLAESLIRQKLAACINMLAPCVSIYEWQGQLEKTTEIPMLIKTTIQCYPALEAAVRALHPYELPEIIHVPVTGGLTAYLNWVAHQASHHTSQQKNI